MPKDTTAGNTTVGSIPFPVAGYEVCWASKRRVNVVPDYVELQNHLFDTYGEEPHWSRVFEYPWVLEKGEFPGSKLVLDAGGGNGPLQDMLAKCTQVVNVDIDPPLNCLNVENLSIIKGDIEYLPFADNSFDRVICVSCLEHTKWPLNIVRELWRVLSPGGRLLITLDVAEPAKWWNFTIDIPLARDILGLFGFPIPLRSKEILGSWLREPTPEGTAEPVLLNVLCFYVDKPSV